MRSFRLLLASSLVALLALGCSQSVDPVDPLAEAPSGTQQVDSAAVLSFVNAADSEQLTRDGALSADEARAVLAFREARGAFASLDQLSAALDSTPRTMLTNPMCSYYQGLAQYYAIRALQCAYSACYPMSPWYGYLSQYYQSLAQAVCPTE